MRLHHWGQEWSVHCSLWLLWWNWILRLHVWSETALRSDWMLTWGNCLWIVRLWRTGLHLLLDERSLSLWDCARLDLSGCLWWEWLLVLMIVGWEFDNDVLLIRWRATFKLLLLILQGLLRLLWRSDVLTRDNLGLKWVIEIGSPMIHINCCFSSLKLWIDWTKISVNGWTGSV